MKSFQELLQGNTWSISELTRMLQCSEEEKSALFRRGAEIKQQYVGNKVYFRGLIELSNSCRKNCYYCGIRNENSKVQRYRLSEQEVMNAVTYAYQMNYGSIVIQSGEKSDTEFIHFISGLLQKINQLSGGKLGITLSLGEQSEDTYKKWFDLGAHRYLLRIETSDPELYRKLHPDNLQHRFDQRIHSLNLLKTIGYQVGSGVMIGLPFQSIEHLAKDLIFLQDLDVDMVGMGPYIEHQDTPLYRYRDNLMTKSERFQLSLKMIALLRIMMKDINMAATTAMQTLDPQGREKAIMVGANIIMPNLTPTTYRENYLLYEDKPCLDEEASECKTCLEARIAIAGSEIGYGEWGDSLHFKQRNQE